MFFVHKGTEKVGEIALLNHKIGQSLFCGCFFYFFEFIIKKDDVSFKSKSEADNDNSSLGETSFFSIFFCRNIRLL